MRWTQGRKKLLTPLIWRCRLIYCRNISYGIDFGGVWMTPRQNQFCPNPVLKERGRGSFFKITFWTWFLVSGGQTTSRPGFRGKTRFCPWKTGFGVSVTRTHPLTYIFHAQTTWSIEVIAFFRGWKIVATSVSIAGMVWFCIFWDLSHLKSEMW